MTKCRTKTENEFWRDAFLCLLNMGEAPHLAAIKADASLVFYRMRAKPHYGEEDAEHDRREAIY